MNSDATLTFVDLFSGVGGMSCGFARHPAFRPRFAVDAQVERPSAGVGALKCNASYEANLGIPVREADLSVYTPEDLRRESGLKRGELDVLIACAPCTGFSRVLNHTKDDPRNHLVERMSMFVDVLRPTLFVMENTRELLRGNFSHHYEMLCHALDGMGYAVSGEVHRFDAFGLPQTRERALVLATRDRGPRRTLRDLWGDLVPTAASVTVRRAIAHLPPVRAGEGHPDDDLHRAPGFSDPLSLERMRAIPPDGGSWSDLLKHVDAQRLLTPSMRRYADQQNFGSHPDVYGRLWWDRPCVTLKRECGHVGNGRFAHPEQHRLCTVREFAILSGFPRDYTLLGSLANRYRLLGNAVPPLISFQVAHLCHWILTGQRPQEGDWCLPGTSLRREDLVARVEAQISMPFGSPT